LAVLFSVLTAAPGQAAEPRVKHLNAGTVMPSDMPFSEGVIVDGMLYLSGQIGVKPGTLELVEGGMTAQARQTMDNVKATLEAHGYGMDDVVKCTVMLADMSQWGDFNQVYQQYFTPPFPARSALGASGLALGGLVEVECWAAVQRP
jgi:reactive intermediate/imine deaminase